MQRLYKATPAKPENGPKAPLNEWVRLEEGTRYRTISHWMDPLGFMWTRIEIRGKQYDILG